MSYVGSNNHRTLLHGRSAVDPRVNRPTRVGPHRAPRGAMTPTILLDRPTPLCRPSTGLRWPLWFGATQGDGVRRTAAGPGPSGKTTWEHDEPAARAYLHSVHHNKGVSAKQKEWRYALVRRAIVDTPLFHG